MDIVKLLMARVREMPPDSAVRIFAESLAREVSLRLRFGDTMTSTDEIEEHAQSNPDLDKNLDEFDFSVRVTNCLESENIRTVRQLIACSPRRLKRIRMFGSQALSEVNERLKSHGLSLRTSKNGEQSTN